MPSRDAEHSIRPVRSDNISPEASHQARNDPVPGREIERANYSRFPRPRTGFGELVGEKPLDRRRLQDLPVQVAVLGVVLVPVGCDVVPYREGLGCEVCSRG